MIPTLAAFASFLFEHRDLVEDVYDVITSGGSKDALKKAIRDVKLSISDEAMKDELGLPR